MVKNSSCHSSPSQSPADPSHSLLTYTAEPGWPSQNGLNLLGSWAATTDGFDQAASTGDSKQAESFSHEYGVRKGRS